MVLCGWQEAKAMIGVCTFATGGLENLQRIKSFSLWKVRSDVIFERFYRLNDFLALHNFPSALKFRSSLEMF